MREGGRRFGRRFVIDGEGRGEKGRDGLGEKVKGGEREGW